MIYVFVYLLIGVWLAYRCDDPRIKATPLQRLAAKVVAILFGPIILISVMLRFM